MSSHQTNLTQLQVLPSWELHSFTTAVSPCKTNIELMSLHQTQLQSSCWINKVEKEGLDDREGDIYVLRQNYLHMHQHKKSSRK